MTSLPELLWAPDDADVAAANVTRFTDRLRSRGLELARYDDLWRWSVEEPEAFWATVWDFYGLAPRDGRVLTDPAMPGTRWFEGTHLNYAEEILARAPAEGPAIIAASEDEPPQEHSAAELRGQVGALAAALRRAGVQRGDAVVGYLPNVPEAVVALLAVTSLGAVWSSCAPDFGTRSVIDRFSQLAPKALVAVDGYRFGGREHDRAAEVRELQAALPSLRATLVVRRLKPGAPPPGAALAFDELVREPCEPTFEAVPFDHPLWVLFSSGTTGLPKGIVHGHGGIVVEHLKALGLCLDLRPGDRFFFYSSTSWMAWNLLVGGLLHGAAVVLYDGSPANPHPDETWRVAAATGTTVLGLGSAYVTACQKADVDVTAPDALRVVIPTGSPLPPAGWRWLHQRLGPRVRIDSICGGTDVCTAFFGGSPLLPVRLGRISARWLGVDAEAVDAGGQAVIGGVGEFVVRSPMPSMPIAFWGDPDGHRLREAYFEAFPGLWRQGDFITIGEDGDVVVHGRSDATLNRGGVRLGSAEIYAVVESLPEVADSLVVGVELDDGAYAMPLFVVPADGVAVDDELRARITSELRRQLSPRHVPDEVVEAPRIPRTLTGKKLEVPVKRMLQGVRAAEAAATGAVDRPDAVAWFERFAQGRRAVRS